MNPTKAIEAIYVLKDPVKPKTALIVLLAFLAGGFGWGLLVIAYAVKADRLQS
jgi:uncharacterized protein involved in exopolysaccharide biosynthesis